MYDHRRSCIAGWNIRARAVAGVAAALWCVGAMAQQLTAPGNVDGPASDLEKAFWVCDYVATTRGIGATPIAHCSAVTDALKNEMFGGDFSELLAWWRQHRHAQHAALARIDQ